MDIQLPPKSDGTAVEIPGGTRQITIIGANGSGKTRFTDYLIEKYRGKSYRMSALNALYGLHRDADTLPGSIDRLYDAAIADPAFMHNEAASLFERLIALMLNEEVACLVDYKVNAATNPDATLPYTKLDRVIAAWHRIFPDNHVLRQGGRLLFARNDDHSPYSQLKLSDGEQAVFYYFGAVLYAPEEAVIFVENPGMFLHPSMMRPLWDAIEQMRPDCTFIYTTHDIEFASTRTSNSIVWVRNFNAEAMTWEYDLLPPDSGISDDIYMAIVGARKPVLFIEGDSIHSIDAKLYPLVFPEYTVKSLGSCNKVIESTRSFNDLSSFHHLDSHGIVDRDRRDDNEVAYLRSKKIFVPDVAEIENILMLEGVIRIVAKRHGKDDERVFRSVKNAVLSQFRQDLRQQALLHTRHRVKRTMECRIDGRFTNINMLEDHIFDLVKEINPRGL